MRSRRRSREAEVDPFYDMLFNMLIALVFCFIVALLAMNPKALKAGDVPAKAEYLVTLSWPDMNPNDINLWVQDPGGNLVWFRAREAGLMHLDRDDRSLANDTIVVNGKQIINPLNQEVVYYGALTLARKGDEGTAVRFTLLPDGGVTNINTLPLQLVERI